MPRQELRDQLRQLQDQLNQGPAGKKPAEMILKQIQQGIQIIKKNPSSIDPAEKAQLLTQLQNLQNMQKIEPTIKTAIAEASRNLQSAGPK